MNKLTQSRLREILYYDKETGVFRRRFSTAQSVKPWDVAGTENKNSGYVFINVDGNQYRAHQLAVLYITGVWPDKDVDHINGVKSDNRWSNLRLVSRGINLQNQRERSKNNKSGFLGVSWSKAVSKWHAQITINHVRKHLGYFKTPEEAHNVYLKAKRELHEGCTI